MDEFVYLKNKESAGLLDDEEQARLDKKTGVLFTFNLLGETWRVNHCLIARAVIGGAILIAALSVIYLCSFTPLQIE